MIPFLFPLPVRSAPLGAANLPTGPADTVCRHPHPYTTGDQNRKIALLSVMSRPVIPAPGLVPGACYLTSY